MQRGPVYATWDVANPTPGTWTVDVANTAAPGTGFIQGFVYFDLPSIPDLPPAGVIKLVHDQCGFFSCTGTFRASVGPSAGKRVAHYVWYDDHGNQQSSSGPKQDTMTMVTYTGAFHVILKTVGVGGGQRFTVASF